MPSTTDYHLHPTITHGGNTAQKPPLELVARYDNIVQDRRLNWTTHHSLLKLLGSGGQGVVFLTELRGADGFTVPVALKIFSPKPFEDARGYSDTMARIATVAARVAQIQHDNLLDIHNFMDRDRIRMMVMEWVDGYDLQRLLVPEMLNRIRKRVSHRRWEYLNRVIVTQGPVQPRVKPGVAVAIVRDCLSALAALHREGVVHGDIKPSNIMLKRTGSAKIVDIGSAFELQHPPTHRSCTPAYAAPEVLEGGEITPLSDLASLGYVLVELLSGQRLFDAPRNPRELLELKRRLTQELPSILPSEVNCNELLMKFCRGLISPDPMLRFPSAETAEMHNEGAAGFHRQLVISDLASEYPNEIRLWLEELKELEEIENRDPQTNTRT
ncbi:MAG: serine/threonine protein kinase [Planctomycetes bacterium]|nr:serine/threonine protein kinase [Planctomycetota bacterium]